MPSNCTFYLIWKPGRLVICICKAFCWQLYVIQLSCFIFSFSHPTAISFWVLAPLDSASWWSLPLYVLAVKPSKGDALLFFSLHPNATTDTKSLHGSCPVIEGEKWSATKWIHVRSFDRPLKRSRNGDCVDENENCTMWAKAGECNQNPIYMIGSGTSDGYCRKSCNACTS